MKKEDSTEKVIKIHNTCVINIFKSVNDASSEVCVCVQRMNKRREQHAAVSTTQTCICIYFHVRPLRRQPNRTHNRAHSLAHTRTEVARLTFRCMSMCMCSSRSTCTPSINHTFKYKINRPNSSIQSIWRGFVVRHGISVCVQLVSPASNESASIALCVRLSQSVSLPCR